MNENVERQPKKFVKLGTKGYGYGKRAHKLVAVNLKIFAARAKDKVETEDKISAIKRETFDREREIHEFGYKRYNGVYDGGRAK
jgi:hypothetical protein